MVNWIRLKKRLRRSWGWFLFVAIYKIVEDRFAGSTNQWIDAHADGLLPAIKRILDWSDQNTLGIAGFLLVGTFLVLMVLSYRDTRTVKKNKKEEKVVTPSSNSSIVDVTNRRDRNLVEFFPTVDDLGPVGEKFKPGNEIHAYLLSGDGVFPEHSENIKCVRRLILPLPDDRNLSRLHAIDADTDFKSRIEKYRNIARSNRKESVRYYKEFTGVSLLFCNPDSPEGWVQVGIILPESEPRDRQHYRIYRATNQKAFIALWNVFNKMWEASFENTEHEDTMESFES